MGKLILIASGKGGTGKTTAAANLGAALSASDKLTLTVDMDIGLRNLDIALGLENSVVYDICDVASELCTLDEALIKHSTYDNLYILSAPQTRKATDFDAEMFLPVWERLKERFDYCVVDAPAGICGGLEYTAAAADIAIVVATPELSALRDADRVISVLEDSGVQDIRLLLNRVRPDFIDMGIMLNADDCVDMLQIPVTGIVPEEDMLRALSLKGELAVSNADSRAGKAFLNTARRIMGEDIPIIDFDERKGFFGRLKKMFQG